MSTNKPKIQGYISKEVYEKFDSWYKERNIKNISNALEILIRDYFDIEANTLLGRLEALELKFEALERKSTINPKVDNQIESTNDALMDNQSTSGLEVDNQIKSTNETLVDNTTDFNRFKDYIDLTSSDLAKLYSLTTDQFKKKSSAGWFKEEGWSIRQLGKKYFYSRKSDKA